MFFGINVWHTVFHIGAPCYLVPFFSNVCVHLEKGKKGSRFPFIMNELYDGLLPYEHVPQAMSELDEIEQELKRIPVSRYVYDFLDSKKSKPMEMKVRSNAQNLFDYITDTEDDEITSKLHRAFTDALYFKENVWIGNAVTDGPNKPYSEENAAHFVYLEQNGGLILDRYFGTLKRIVIPAYKDELPVTAIGEKAFSDNNSAEEIILPETVTELGEECFYSCGHLERISLGKRIVKIGKGAFESCYQLSSIELPETLKVIAEEAFSACFALTEVAVPDSVECIEKEAFADCRKLSAITIPASVAEISTLAFKKTKKHLTIIAPLQSAAAKYAKKYKIEWHP